jgi:pimeloyl-ACP methyl ester carboxylesterase
MSTPGPKLVSALILSFSCLVPPCAAAQNQPVVESIAGRQVESLTIHNPASPLVVVFEAGSRGTIDKWGKVLEGAGRDATVFAYNRPGYGNSEASTTPRDGRTVVEELRQVLRHKGLKPPYVLGFNSTPTLIVMVDFLLHCTILVLHLQKVVENA